jgi:hypothetical protein
MYHEIIKERTEWSRSFAFRELKKYQDSNTVVCIPGVAHWSRNCKDYIPLDIILSKKNRAPFQQGLPSVPYRVYYS